MASPVEGGPSSPHSRSFDEPMPYVTGHTKRTSLVPPFDLAKEVMKPPKPQKSSSKPPSRRDSPSTNAEYKRETNASSDSDRPGPKELREDYLDRINLDIPSYPLPPWRGAAKTIPPLLSRVLKIQQYLAEDDAKREELEKELEKDDLSIRSVGRARHKILNPDDLLEYEAQSQINAILSELVKAELDYEQSLQVLLTHYSEQIFAARLLAPGVSDAFGKFMSTVTALLKLHHDMGTELQSKLNQGSLDLVSTLETYEPLFDPCYPDFMKQMPFVVTETSHDRVPAMGSLLQTLEKEAPGGRKLASLLEDPMRQIESYIRRLTLLQRLLPGTHPSCVKLKRLLARFRDRGKALQEALTAATEGAQLSDLEAKVTSVPDNWTVRDSRHLFASVLVTQLYGSFSEHADAPAVHPHKSKKGETCRLFALDHCLLLTSFDYKYRQRIDLQEITASARGEHFMVLSRDFLSLGHLPASVEEDPATPVTLLFNSFQERNMWVQRITDVTEALSLKMANEFTKFTEDAKFSEGLLVPEDATTYDASSPVTVFLRLRPFITKEEVDSGLCAMQIAGPYAAIEGRVEDDTGEEKRILHHKIGVFAKVFSPSTPQFEVVARVEREPLDALMAGSNALVFAYGGIGTGKTYTMFGDEEPGRSSGVVQRLIEQVFVRLKAANSDEKEEKITISCLQVFNDKLQDLQGGKILQDIKSVLPRRPGEPPAIFKELTEAHVMTSKEALTVLKEALRTRTTRSHPLNDTSSRSHIVVILKIRCKLKGEHKRMALYMVDLAGFDASGTDPSEAVHTHDIQDRGINSSLVSFERVLNGLGENRRRLRRKKIHVPFAEHKLSLVLTDVLSSDHTFPTTVILTAAPSSFNQIESTLKTLQFGDSVKKYGGHRFGGHGVYVRQGHWTEGLQKLWDRL